MLESIIQVATQLHFCHSGCLLANIKPIHVCKWMTFKACGKEDPGQDDHPVKRASSIERWKRAVSCLFHTMEPDLQFGDGAGSQWLLCEGMRTSQDATKERDAKAQQGKDACARALKRATGDSCFTRIESESNQLGSHSIQETAAAQCREQGCTRGDLDCQP